MTTISKWYWYAARSDELLIDLDSQTLLEIALKRLAKPELDIRASQMFLTESATKGHFHMAVRLRENVAEVRRMLFQLYLMDHVYRSVKNFDRALNNVSAASLLISPHNWANGGLNRTKFWRSPDAICHCLLAKHKSHKAILSCPAHVTLRSLP